jgi:putative addiction module component (TIGR02574 family)
MFIALANKRRCIMTTVADKVLNEALALPADARIGLVEKLLTSLNLPIQPEIEHLWAEEAEQRFSQIQYGEAKLVPGERVFNEIRQKYQKK